MNVRVASILALALVPTLAGRADGQPYGDPDRGEPGDAMIQAYLARVASEQDGKFSGDIKSLEHWNQQRNRFRDEYLFMLGLDPLPEKTPLRATVTGTFAGDGYIVENLHYQSVPGLYVTANLYRPAETKPGDRIPAVLYVCGHSGMGRDGNKAAFQSHGIWFARHGYVCLVVDTLQLGEIPGIHHGTYREGRWWWHSRGYTPAGVECWNGVRGIDYLTGRDEVDPDQISVTGISGGGAATFWIAAADDRVKLAVPVSGMADLTSYVSNRVVNGHCDCMFLYNGFEWPWTRIAGLIAPRPMLFVNSDADAIFPMDANERVIARLERLYSLFSASDTVDAVVSVGGHAYRQDIRQAAYRFHNTHLKDDPRQITDSEVDLVAESGSDRRFPIPPVRLRAFPTDADIPSDALNGSIDRHFVPTAKVEPPAEGGFDNWKARLLTELQRKVFHHFPDRVPAARPVGEPTSDGVQLTTEEGITIPLKTLKSPTEGNAPKRILLVIDDGEPGSLNGPPEGLLQDGDAAFLLQPRGVGPTRWTREDPPNYVARAHALLGRTVDSGRVWDVAAVTRHLATVHGEDIPVVLVGRGGAGVLAAYAALIEPEVAQLVLIDTPASHMEPAAPQLLNVLRVLDIPEALGMLAPRPLTLRGIDESASRRVQAIYKSAAAEDHLDAPRSP
jgi:dienelactone hydrolase